MIVADSSVWIPFFRREVTQFTRHLTLFVAEGRVLLPDLVMLEVLQGCTTQRTFDQIRRAFDSLPVLVISNPNVAVAAARNYRALRAIGFTVRSTIDTLIATRCIMDGHKLLHDDRDFDGFERHLGLRVVSPQAVS